MHGTPGQQKIPETALCDPLVIEPLPQDPAPLRERVGAHRGDILFLKHGVDVFTNPNVEPVLEVLDPKAVVVYGVALDICNRYVIEGLLARRPATQLVLVSDGTKPIVADRAGALLEEWARRGVKLMTAEEVIRFGERTRAAGVSMSG